MRVFWAFRWVHSSFTRPHERASVGKRYIRRLSSSLASISVLSSTRRALTRRTRRSACTDHRTYLPSRRATTHEPGVAPSPSRGRVRGDGSCVRPRTLHPPTPRHATHFLFRATRHIHTHRMHTSMYFGAQTSEVPPTLSNLKTKNGAPCGHAIHSRAVRTTAAKGTSAAALMQLSHAALTPPRRPTAPSWSARQGTPSTSRATSRTARAATTGPCS